MQIRTLEEHPLGLSWVADDYLSRTSHAVVADGRVWFVDPVDIPEAVEQGAALGEPAGVLQLFGAHNRDGAAIAKRLGVPLHVMPETLPEAPFSLLSLDRMRIWKEVALWWPEPKALIVAEAVGTGHLYALGPGPAGVHPLRRALPPGELRPFAPEHLLVGHGPPVHGGEAAAALLDALDRSRRDIPKVLLAAPSMLRGGLARA